MTITVPKDESIKLSNLEFADAEKNIADGVIKKVSAFTVAELGGMLPVFPNGFPFLFTADRKALSLRNDNASSQEWIEGKTEADARAKMLIYLLERGLLSTQ